MVTNVSANRFRGVDHVEPRQDLIPVSRRDPVTGEQVQPEPYVRIAYWFGVRMHNYGWQLRSFTYVVGADHNPVATVAALDPSGVVQTYRTAGTVNDPLDLPHVFAAAIRAVGVIDGHAAVRELRDLLAPLTVAMPARHWSADYRRLRHYPKRVGGKQFIARKSFTKEGRW
ncbi:Uncharacterised protein [Mycobacteroides abscessus subsp. bolletii]|uniref:hypothetical protein n=1 Tax=Mycobacteroides abscessus TaxID=36809 RepID=UPI0009A58FDB|nr:hypothetical protein [Mycobacteroides abscessus]SKZ03219.1 Uncharacterised protein [Mycobacteroides abscessus subsp. bolletii]